MIDTITLPRSVIEKAIDTIGYYASVAGEDDQDTPAKQMQAALRAALAQQAEQGWQPIEIAPKINPMKPEHRLIFWIDGVGPAFGYAYDDGAGGLLTVIDGYYGGRWEPTHWKPMLAAPQGVV